MFIYKWTALNPWGSLLKMHFKDAPIAMASDCTLASQECFDQGYLLGREKLEATGGYSL